MFTAGQAPVTFRCRPRWWSIFPFSAPSARRWPALLPSLSAFLLFRPAGSASRVLPLSCSSFRRSAAHSRPLVFLLPSGSSRAAAPWAALCLCSCPRAAAGGASSRSFPFLGSFPSCGPSGRLWSFFPPWLFLFFCSSLSAASGSQDLSFALFFSPPYGGSSRPSALLFLLPRPSLPVLGAAHSYVCF